MGRWLAVLGRRPPHGEHSILDEYRRDILGEITPHPLIHAFEHIPKDLREQFPMLKRIRLRSDAYVEECLLLSPEEVRQLEEEYYRLRQLGRGEETLYFSGRRFDPELFMTRWRGIWSAAESEDHLRSIDALLQKAVCEHAWILISL
jgi:hypothetical protein